MSLPLDQEIKDYLRISTDVEDFLIQGINLSAQAWLRAFYNVPLVQQSRTFRGLWPRVGAEREQSFRGIWPLIGVLREPGTRLVVPIKPCATSGTLTDAEGATVSSSTYVIDPRSGFVAAKRGQSFGNPPYDITLDVGWLTHPDYDSDIDPILRQAVFWAASTYYRNRNVAAIYEQSGGQVSITYTEQEIPPLLRSLLAGLKDAAWYA